MPGVKLGALDLFMLGYCLGAEEYIEWDAADFPQYGIGNMVSRINPEVQGRDRADIVHAALDLREKLRGKGGG